MSENYGEQLLLLLSYYCLIKDSSFFDSPGRSFLYFFFVS